MLMQKLQYNVKCARDMYIAYTVECSLRMSLSRRTDGLHEHRLGWAFQPSFSNWSSVHREKFSCTCRVGTATHPQECAPRVCMCVCVYERGRSKKEWKWVVDGGDRWTIANWWTIAQLLMPYSNGRRLWRESLCQLLTVQDEECCERWLHMCIV